MKKLQEAYKRVGITFGGQIQQHYVVLKNECVHVGSWGENHEVHENRITPNKRENALLKGANKRTEAKLT
jgi:hypothetical protein